MRNLLNYQTIEEFNDNESVGSDAIVLWGEHKGTGGNVFTRYTYISGNQTGYTTPGLYIFYDEFVDGPCTADTTIVNTKRGDWVIRPGFRVYAPNIQRTLYAEINEENREIWVYGYLRTENDVVILDSNDELGMLVSADKLSFGAVTSIIPGVAYCRENHKSYYNNGGMPQVVIDTWSEGLGYHYTWEQLGLPASSFGVYKSMAKRVTHPNEWNIILREDGTDGEITGYSYMLDQVEYVSLRARFISSRCQYDLYIGEDGMYARKICLE